MLGMIRQAEVALKHFGYAHRRPQVVGLERDLKVGPVRYKDVSVLVFIN